MPKGTDWYDILNGSRIYHTEKQKKYHKEKESMMKTKWNAKRLLSALLTLCMVLSLLPAVSVTASAADEGGTIP